MNRFSEDNTSRAKLRSISSLLGKFRDLDREMPVQQ